MCCSHPDIVWTNNRAAAGVTENILIRARIECQKLAKIEPFQAQNHTAETNFDEIYPQAWLCDRITFDKISYPHVPSYYMSSLATTCLDAVKCSKLNFNK